VPPTQADPKTTAAGRGADKKNEADDFFRNTRFIGEEEVKTTSEPQRQPPAAVQHPHDTAMAQTTEEVKAEKRTERTDDTAPPEP
jgi:hypothetical protein